VFHNRAVARFRLKQYEQAWADIGKCQELGGRVSPEFIEALTQASSRPGS